MNIVITDKDSNLAGFISWRRLAIELFPHELAAGERVSRFEISDRGIHYFVEKDRKEQ